MASPMKAKFSIVFRSAVTRYPIGEPREKSHISELAGGFYSIGRRLKRHYCGSKRASCENKKPRL
jgi:hypothetical protein